MPRYVIERSSEREREDYDHSLACWDVVDGDGPSGRRPIAQRLLRADADLISVDGLDIEPSLLPSEVVTFLINQDSPNEFFATESFMVVRWENGRWARVQFINAKMPNLELIFEKAGPKAEIEITDDWRNAYVDAQALSDDTVTILSTGIKGNKGVSSVDIDIKIDGLPIDHRSHWSTSVLEPVIACATHWNPNSYPKPSLFIGKNLRGVVVGVGK